MNQRKVSNLLKFLWVALQVATQKQMDAPGTGVTEFWCRDQMQVFLQVDDNISQVTVDHGI